MIGQTGFEIEIRGRLDELLEAPTFMRRSAAGSGMVAGEGAATSFG
jgi:hypothetical protein